MAEIKVQSSSLHQIQSAYGRISRLEAIIAFAFKSRNSFQFSLIDFAPLPIWKHYRQCHVLLCHHLSKSFVSQDLGKISPIEIL